MLWCTEAKGLGLEAERCPSCRAGGSTKLCVQRAGAPRPLTAQAAAACCLAGCCSSTKTICTASWSALDKTRCAGLGLCAQDWDFPATELCSSRACFSLENLAETQGIGLIKKCSAQRCSNSSWLARWLEQEACRDRLSRSWARKSLLYEQQSCVWLP